MRAAFCTAPGVFELDDVAPLVPAPGEAIVRVSRCGICGSDLHFFRSGSQLSSVCPGHEISGEVVDVAGAAGRITIGERVAVEPLVRCRECWACRTGDYQLCSRMRVLGNTLNGGFAEYVGVPTYALFRLPAGLDLDVAALTEPLSVAVHAVRLTNVRSGDRVLVLGAGTIGLLSVAAARSAGAGDVWITARHPHQCAAARALGAARVFTGPDADDEMLAAAPEHPVDVVIEAVGGTADTINQAVRAVRPAGKVAVLGLFTTMPPLHALLLMVKEVRIVGSLMYGRSGARADFESALQLLAAHQELFRQLLTHRFPLSEITRAFETAADKRSGSIKVSIAPET